jgi:NTP pyrophosphatase (non-canonical NTP hydrolase)
MKLNEYQDAAQEFAVYPHANGIEYTALGLAEEAGEYAGKVAKAIRKRADVDYEAAAQELGDVLWQTSQAAREIGYTLEDIALMNLDKLYARAQAGTLVGEGDNR